MIKVRTFKLSDYEKANKFLEEHRPFTTEKSSGLQLNDGHLVIFYDDGVLNPIHVKQKFVDLMQKEEENIALFSHNLTRHINLLQETAPKGYKKNLKDTEIRTLCEAEGNPPKNARERTEAIIELENQILMTSHSISHSEKEIELYKKTIANIK